MHFHYPIDHIAHAVPKLEEAIQFYERNYQFPLIYRERREDSGIDLVFFETGNTKIEILSPFREKNVLSEFLAKRGPGLHHICYEVEDIETELARMKALGHTLIDEKPREGAMNSRIAFLHPGTNLGILVELCQHRARGIL